MYGPPGGLAAKYGDHLALKYCSQRPILLHLDRLSNPKTIGSAQLRPSQEDAARRTGPGLINQAPKWPYFDKAMVMFNRLGLDRA